MTPDRGAPAQHNLFPEPPPAADFAAAWTENAARNNAAQAAEDRAAHAHEHRRMIRGLLLLGTIVLLASLIHAGTARAFYPNWWSQW